MKACEVVDRVDKKVAIQNVTGRGPGGGLASPENPYIRRQTILGTELSFLTQARSI